MRSLLALLVLVLIVGTANAQTQVYRPASMAGHPTSNSCPKVVFSSAALSPTVIRCPDTGVAKTWFLPYAFPENSSTTLNFRIMGANRAAGGKCTWRVGISCNPDGTNQVDAGNSQTFLSKEIVSGNTGADQLAVFDSTTGIVPTNDNTNAACDSTNCDNVDCLISVENDPDNTQTLGDCDFYGIYVQ